MIPRFSTIYIDGHRLHAEAFMSEYEIEHYACSPYIGDTPIRYRKTENISITIVLPSCRLEIVSADVIIENDSLYINGVIDKIFGNLKPVDKLTGWKAAYLKSLPIYSGMHMLYDVRDDNACFTTEIAQAFKLGYREGVKDANIRA